MSDAVTPFYLAIPEAQIDDLKARLRLTRWPEKETVDDWRQGAPLEAVQALCDHWLNRYDWRRCEARLNGFGQFRTELDGLGIHFLHVRSPDPEATPLLMTHGWPGSSIEFHKVIGPLTDPAAHGADPADAFHIVAPSLPGYGFSDRPTETGWTSDRIATSWTELTARLSWESFLPKGFPPVTVPTACSLFPKEIVRPSREAAARRYPNIFYWNAPERRGHFAAFEQPELFVRESAMRFANVQAVLDIVPAPCPGCPARARYHDKRRQ